ncbi:MAG: contractile injection system tape measure protein [Nannocystaceae bacterium]
MTHRVRRQILEIEVSDPAAGRRLQDALLRLQRERIVPALERIFDAIAGPDELLRIDRLEVDLGALDPDAPEEALLVALDRQLRDGLARALAAAPDRPPGPSHGPPSAQSREARIRASRRNEREPVRVEGARRVDHRVRAVEAIERFARTGALPWWWIEDRGPRRLHDLVDALRDGDPHLLVELLRRLCDEPRALARLATLLDDARLEALVTGLRRAIPPAARVDPRGSSDDDEALDHGAPAEARARGWARLLVSAAAGGGRSTPRASPRPGPIEPTPATSLDHGVASTPRAGLDADGGAPTKPRDGDRGRPRRDASVRATRRSSADTEGALASSGDHPGDPHADPLPAALTDALATWVDAAADALAALEADGLGRGGVAGPRSRGALERLQASLAAIADAVADTPDDDALVAPLRAAGREPPDPRRALELSLVALAGASARRSPAATVRLRRGLEAALLDARAELRSSPRADAAPRPRGVTDEASDAASLTRVDEGPRTPGATRGDPSPRDPSARAPSARAPSARVSPLRLASRPGDRAASSPPWLDEPLPVDDAGLVLLWPFLPHLFDRLGLLADRRLRDRAASVRAAGLLRALATGEREIVEYQAPLARALCGVDPDELFAFDPPVTDDEEVECLGLLEAVIDRATILKKMTIAGLRGTFLLRPGLLGRRDGALLLRVERREYDAVLDRFPWTFEWVRLPWMLAPLRVEW